MLLRSSSFLFLMFILFFFFLVSLRTGRRWQGAAPIAYDKSVCNSIPLELLRFVADSNGKYNLDQHIYVSSISTESPLIKYISSCISSATYWFITCNIRQKQQQQPVSSNERHPPEWFFLSFSCFVIFFFVHFFSFISTYSTYSNLAVEENNQLHNRNNIWRTCSVMYSIICAQSIFEGYIRYVNVDITECVIFICNTHQIPDSMWGFFFSLQIAENKWVYWMVSNCEALPRNNTRTHSNDLKRQRFVNATKNERIEKETQISSSKLVGPNAGRFIQTSSSLSHIYIYIYAIHPIHTMHGAWIVITTQNESTCTAETRTRQHSTTAANNKKKEKKTKRNNSNNWNEQQQQRYKRLFLIHVRIILL